MTDADDHARRVRRVADRLRRRKRALERRNPFHDLGEYRASLEELVTLEARLRDLREAPGQAPDEPADGSA